MPFSHQRQRGSFCRRSMNVQRPPPSSWAALVVFALSSRTILGTLRTQTRSRTPASDLTPPWATSGGRRFRARHQYHEMQISDSDEEGDPPTRAARCEWARQISREEREGAGAMEKRGVSSNSKFLTYRGEPNPRRLPHSSRFPARLRGPHGRVGPLPQEFEAGTGGASSSATASSLQLAFHNPAGAAPQAAERMQSPLLHHPAEQVTLQTGAPGNPSLNLSSALLGRERREMDPPPQDEPQIHEVAVPQDFRGSFLARAPAAAAPAAAVPHLEVAIVAHHGHQADVPVEVGVPEHPPTVAVEPEDWPELPASAELPAAAELPLRVDSPVVQSDGSESSGDSQRGQYSPRSDSGCSASGAV